MREKISRVQRDRNGHPISWAILIIIIGLLGWLFTTLSSEGAFYPQHKIEAPGE